MGVGGVPGGPGSAGHKLNQTMTVGQAEIIQ